MKQGAPYIALLYLAFQGLTTEGFVAKNAEQSREAERPEARLQMESLWRSPGYNRRYFVRADQRGHMDGVLVVR